MHRTRATRPDTFALSRFFCFLGFLWPNGPRGAARGADSSLAVFRAYRSTVLLKPAARRISKRGISLGGHMAEKRRGRFATGNPVGRRHPSRLRYDTRLPRSRLI